MKAPKFVVCNGQIREHCGMEPNDECADCTPVKSWVEWRLYINDAVGAASSFRSRASARRFRGEMMNACPRSKYTIRPVLCLEV